MSNLIDVSRQFTVIRCKGGITKDVSRRAFEAGMRGEPTLIVQTNPKTVTLQWETEIFLDGVWEIGDIPIEVRESLFDGEIGKSISLVYVCGGSGLVKGMEPETAERMLAILRETRVRYPHAWRSEAV